MCRSLILLLVMVLNCKYQHKRKKKGQDFLCKINIGLKNCKYQSHYMHYRVLVRLFPLSPLVLWSYVGIINIKASHSPHQIHKFKKTFSHINFKVLNPSVLPSLGLLKLIIILLQFCL